MLKEVRLKAIAHITGGGFFENIPRVIPNGLAAKINIGSWNAPPIFKIVKRLSGMTDTEMFSSLNMGIGLVMMISKGDSAEVLSALEAAGEANASVIGEVVRGEGIILT